MMGSELMPLMQSMLALGSKMRAKRHGFLQLPTGLYLGSSPKHLLGTSKTKEGARTASEATLHCKSAAFHPWP